MLANSAVGNACVIKDDFLQLYSSLVAFRILAFASLLCIYLVTDIHYKVAEYLRNCKSPKRNYSSVI